MACDGPYSGWDFINEPAGDSSQRQGADPVSAAGERSTPPSAQCLASELANLRERISRTSRNSSRPPSSDSPGFYPPERRKGSGRKRGGSRAIPVLDLSCCHWSAVTTSSTITLRTALAAAPCSMETTPSHFAIR